jgi:hypothetical protein
LETSPTAFIKGAVLTRLVHLALRHIFSAEPRTALEPLVALIGQVIERTTGLEILEALLRYYVTVTERLDEDDVRALLQAIPEGEALMPTFIDHYIDQGRKQGVKQGEATVLARQLARRFGPLSSRTRARLQKASVAELERWADNILDAATLDEVFEGRAPQR